MSTQNIQYQQGGSELLDRIESLWIELREYHVGLSTNFGRQMAAATFTERKAGLIEKASDGSLLVDLAIDSEDDVIGYCVTLVDGESQGELESIYVNEAMRGHGIGQHLVQRSMDWLDQLGITKRCVIVAFENQRVMSLYQSVGFKPRLIRMECHNGDDVDA